MIAQALAAFACLTLTTQTTCRAASTEAARGKTAVCMVCCVTRRGAIGPWSDTSSATIAA